MPQIFSSNLVHSGNLLLWQTNEELSWFKEQLNLMPELWDEYESLSNEVIRHRWLASRFAPDQARRQNNPLFACFLGLWGLRTRFHSWQRCFDF